MGNIRLQGHLRLKNYVYFGLTTNGILFEGGGRSFVLKNKQLYPLVSKLNNLMDNGHSIEQIMAALPDNIKGVGQTILQQLYEHQFLLDNNIQQSVLTHYPFMQENIEFLHFLEDNIGDYREAFANWRQQTVTVIGNGYGLLAFVKALIPTGIGHICIQLMESSSTSSDYFKKEIESLYPSAEGTHFSITLLTEKERDSLPGEEQLVAYIDDDLEQLLKARQEVHESTDYHYIVAGVYQQHGIVSPVKHSGITDFFDLKAWLTANKNKEGHSPLSMGVIGNLALLSLIGHYFKCHHDTSRNSVALVSSHLDISSSPILPRQLSAKSDNVTTTYPQKYQSDDSTTSTLYQKVSGALWPLFDDITGPFDLTVAEKLQQLPLYHDAIAVTLPTTQTIRSPRTIIAWGEDAEDAGLRVIRQSISYLATEMHQPSLALAVEFEQQRWQDSAICNAIIKTQHFQKYAKRLIIQPDKLNAPEHYLLTQLLKIYHPSKLDISLHFIEGFSAFLCFIDGVKNTHWGVDNTPYGAIKEALGATLSGCQFEHYKQQPAPVKQLELNVTDAISDSEGKLLPILEQNSHYFDNRKQHCRFHQYTLGMDTDLLKIGYAELAEDYFYV